MAKRDANTQITKDSMSDGEGVWGSGAQASGPQRAPAAQLAARKMARPRARRPPGVSRPPPPGMNQQMQLPSFGSTEGNSDANNFTFGQQPNGAPASASFPPFGNNNNTQNNGGASSSFNVPSSGFNFNIGAPAAVNNPFASLSSPSSHPQPSTNPSTTNTSQNSLFNYQPPQASSTSSLFSQNNQLNGIAQSSAEPPKVIFGSAPASTQESQNNTSTSNLFLQPPAVQEQQATSFGQSQNGLSSQMASNPFGNANNGQGSPSNTDPPTPASSSVFAHLNQNKSPTPSNIFQQGSGSIFAQPATSQPTSSSNNIFGQQQQPQNNIFGQTSGANAQNMGSSNNIFGQAQPAANIFNKPPSDAGSPQQSSNIFGQQPPTPAQPESQPNTDLWGGHSSAHVQKTFGEIFGGKKQGSNEQPQPNADMSMMQTSPDNSPEAKQQAASKRPFSFLNSGSTQSSPTKNPNAPLGRSLFDRASAAPNNEAQSVTASNQGGGSVGEQAPKTNGIEEAASSATPMPPTSPRKKFEIGPKADEQTTTESTTPNPFARIPSPPKPQPATPAFVLNKTSNNNAPATGNQTSLFPSSSSMNTAQASTPSGPFKFGNSNSADTAASSSKLFPSSTMSSGTPQVVANQPPQMSSTQNAPSPFKPVAQNPPAVPQISTSSSSLNPAQSSTKISTSAAPETNASDSQVAAAQPSKSAKPINPFDMRINIPEPPAEFTESQKLQYITGWRLKTLDSGAKSYVRDHPNMTDRLYEQVKRFYNLKVQAVLAANGGPMDNLDPMTGEKRKANPEGDDTSNKRARVGTQVPPQTPNVNSQPAPAAAPPTQSTSLQPAASNPSKRKASDDVEDPSSTSKRARANEGDAMQTASTPGSQTSGLFRDILQNKSSPAKPKPLTESTPQATAAASPFKVPSFGTPQATSAASSFKVPSFGTPSGSSSFIAQFGQAAKKEAEKEKAKRKAEDFDSDEEDEAAWERRDAEAQREKRKKVEEQSSMKSRYVPGKGFVFDKPNDATTSEASDGEVSNSSLSVLDPQHPSHSSTNTPNLFSHLSDVESMKDGSKTGDADDEDAGSEESDEDAPAEAPAPKQSSPSLFDRITKDQNGNPVREPAATGATSKNPFQLGSGTANRFFPNSTPATSGFGSTAAAPASNIFGQSPSAFATKTSPAKSAQAASTENEERAKGDHTWKPNEPVRFGSDGADDRTSGTTASASGNQAPLGSLFGSFTNSKATDSPTKPASVLTGSNSTNAISTGFGFGITPPKPFTNSLAPPSNITSRATSPGLTTGESANESAADAEEEGGEKHEQLDLTAGGPGEEDEDVVYEVRARTSKYDDTKKEWITQGLGPLRILKNRETGNTRILMRQDPSGRVLINSAIHGEMNYKAESKSIARIPMMGPSGKFEPWIVKVGKNSDAIEMAAKLEECKQKN